MYLQARFQFLTTPNADRFQSLFPFDDKIHPGRDEPNGIFHDALLVRIPRVLPSHCVGGCPTNLRAEALTIALIGRDSSAPPVHSWQVPSPQHVWI